MASKAPVAPAPPPAEISKLEEEDYQLWRFYNVCARLESVRQFVGDYLTGIDFNNLAADKRIVFAPHSHYSCCVTFAGADDTLSPQAFAVHTIGRMSELSEIPWDLRMRAFNSTQHRLAEFTTIRSVKSMLVAREKICRQQPSRSLASPSVSDVSIILELQQDADSVRVRMFEDTDDVHRPDFGWLNDDRSMLEAINTHATDMLATFDTVTEEKEKMDALIAQLHQTQWYLVDNYRNLNAMEAEKERMMDKLLARIQRDVEASAASASKNKKK